MAELKLEGEPEPTPAAQPEGPLYNVMASLASGTNIEELRRLAKSELGLTDDKIDPLVKALRSGPQVRLASKVTKERADQAKADFTKIGIKIDLMPDLAIGAIAPKEDDKLTACPSCDERVELTAQRQCPACGVFVDKLSADFLMRKKIMQQERAAAEFRKAKDSKDADQKSQAALEKQIRDEIRKELEEEMGLGGKKGLLEGIFSGKPGLVRAVVFGGAVVIALVGGRYSTKIPGLEGDDAKTAAAAAKVLAEPDPAKASVNKLMGTLDNPADSTAAAAQEASIEAMDAALGDDSLMSPKAGGGKKLTAEQAVAAANKLAGMAGNTTGARGMAGGGAAGIGGTGGTRSNSGEAPPVDTGEGGGAAGAGGGAAEYTLPAAARTALSAEFAVGLAEIGQIRRAREIIKAMRTKPEVISDAKLGAQTRLASVEIAAWTATVLPSGNARKEVEALRDEINKLPTSGERVVGFARAAAILAPHRSKLGEAGAALAALGGEQMGGVSRGQQGEVIGELAVAVGSVALAELTDHLRAGRVKAAEAAHGKLTTAISQAGAPAAAAKLLTLEYRAQTLLGREAKATAALDNAIARAGKAGALSEQIYALQGVVEHLGAAAPAALQEAINKWVGLAEASKGSDRSSALNAASILSATTAGEEKAAALRSQAAEADAGKANWQLGATEGLVRSDIALAKARHTRSEYTQVETVVQRIAGYLF